MNERAVLPAPPPEGDQRTRPLMRQRHLVQRIVPLVEEEPSRLPGPDLLERLEEPAAPSGVVRRRLVLVVPRLRQLPPVDVRRRQVRLGNQPVVLTEPYEDSGQDPRDRHLRELLVEPGLPRRRRTAELTGLLVLDRVPFPDLGTLVDLPLKVLLGFGDLRLEVVQQGLAVDHPAFSSMLSVWAGCGCRTHDSGNGIHSPSGSW